MPLRPAMLWADVPIRRAGPEMADATLAGRAEPPGFAGRHRFRGDDDRLAAASTSPTSWRKAADFLQPKDWLRAALGGGSPPTRVTRPAPCCSTSRRALVARERSTGWHRPGAAARGPGVRRRGRRGRASAAAERLQCVVGGADTACALAGLGARAGRRLRRRGQWRAGGAGDGRAAARRRRCVRTRSRRRAPSVGAGTASAPCRAPGSRSRPRSPGSAPTPRRRRRRWARACAPTTRSSCPTCPASAPPSWIPPLRGSWHGLTLATDRPAMLRSVLEGVAQAVALGVEAVRRPGTRCPTSCP